MGSKELTFQKGLILMFANQKVMRLLIQFHWLWRIKGEWDYAKDEIFVTRINLIDLKRDRRFSPQLTWWVQAGYTCMDQSMHAIMLPVVDQDSSLGAAVIATLKGNYKAQHLICFETRDGEPFGPIQIYRPPSDWNMHDACNAS